MKVYHSVDAQKLGRSHVSVSLVYVALQPMISLVMLCLIPDIVWAHYWVYLFALITLLTLAYVLFFEEVFSFA